jgi:phytoene/squalene synthetase
MPAEPVAELPAGSGPYYVVRFSRPRQRALMRGAFRFAAELDGSVARSTDPGVTRLKLDWWRRELAIAEQSKHPLIRRLAPLAGQAQGLAALQAMLDAAEADVLRRQPADSQAFVAHCTQAGSLSVLLCLAAGHAAGGSEPLGCYAAAVARIQALGGRLQRDHNPLPRDSALAPDSTQWAASELALACHDLLEPLWQAASQVLRDRAADTLPARRWASQARAVHKLLAREGYPVRQAHLDITPLGKLWAAWRVR